MSCPEERTHAILLAVYEELAPGARPELEEHLAACQACQEFHQETEALRRLAMTDAARLEVRSPAPRFLHALAVQHFEAHAPAPRRPRSWLTLGLVPLLAALFMGLMPTAPSLDPGLAWDTPRVEAGLLEVSEDLEALDGLLARAQDGEDTLDRMDELLEDIEALSDELERGLL